MKASTASIIDGRAYARSLREKLAIRVAALRGQSVGVRLDAVLACDAGSAAHVYAQSQGRACAQVGIDYRLHELAPGARSYDDIAGRVLLLNTESDCHAMMLHLPLPEGIDPYTVQRLISPAKDVEGVNPANIGNIVYGRSSLAPCTALAAVALTESVQPALRGKSAVVVGASNIVGKPIAALLMQRDATVISCNVWTQGLADLTRRADVLVAAAGVPGLITPSMVKPGAVVVDVGATSVTRDDGRTVVLGDVDFQGVSAVAGALSPVPGGVGPVTVAMLLQNVVDAAGGTLRS